MANPCVHCGHPIVEQREGKWPDHTHRDGELACPDGSGHIACPAEAGYE
jgi:hypothetical protein